MTCSENFSPSRYTGQGFFKITAEVGLKLLLVRRRTGDPPLHQRIFIVSGEPRHSAEAAMTLREGGRFTKDCKNSSRK